MLRSVENLTLGAIGFSCVVFGFSQVLKSDLCKKPLDRHPFDSAGPVTSSQLIPTIQNVDVSLIWFLGDVECFKCSDGTVITNRRVIKTQVF